MDSYNNIMISNPLPNFIRSYQYNQRSELHQKYHTPYNTRDFITHPLPDFKQMMLLKEYTAWWRHQMETFSALLAHCAGNSAVPGEFPAQRPVTRSFDVFFDLRPN